MTRTLWRSRSSLATVIGLAVGSALLTCQLDPATAHGQETPSVVEQTIAEAAERWGADPALMYRLAVCESSLNPLARNPRDGSMGLFQFAPVTWPWASEAAGYGGASPYDAEANANTAARLLAMGETQHWAGCLR